MHIYIFNYFIFSHIIYNGRFFCYQCLQSACNTLHFDWVACQAKYNQQDVYWDRGAEYNQQDVYWVQRNLQSPFLAAGFLA